MKTKSIFVFLFICIFLSCDTDRLSSEKSILSYKIEAAVNDLDADITGIVDEDNKTITLDRSVPANRELVATFEAVGTVFISGDEQKSQSSANRYTHSLTYTVYAEDGSSINYTVLFTTIPTARMNSFTLTIDQAGTEKTIRGEIDHKESSIYLRPTSNNWIENLNEAIATFEADGDVTVEGIEQISRQTKNDFRKELLYKVRSQDHSVAEYKVVIESPQTTNLPILIIDTENAAPIQDKENYINAAFRLVDFNNSHNDTEGTVGIRGRGNSTWWNPKKPYRIKFDKKTSLFGYGAAKSWVLLANYQDPTLSMNAIAFEVGRLFDFEFVNHSNHVELFLNDKYMGNYMLTEQVQVDGHRVDIDEDEDYLLELDSYFDEDFKWKTPVLQLPVNIKSPEFTNDDEMQFIVDEINALEKLVTDSEFPDNNYKEMIDVSSLIDYFLVNEIVGNAELYHPKSVYLYKRKGDKIKMGPLWDFDWGFGYYGYEQEYFAPKQSLTYHQWIGGSSTALPGATFFARFFLDPEFKEAYSKRWNQKKGELSSIFDYIDGLELHLEKSAKENKEEWSNYKDFNAEMKKLRSWLTERIQFLDASFPL